VSLIESSLDKLRRVASVSKPTPAAPTIGPAAARAEAAAREPRYVHKRTVVDLGRLRAEGYLPDATQERRFADYCHRIKRPLIDRVLASGGANDARLMLVSSALPGDGKTFITLNLAFSMARERDLSVLLVDGDLPKCQITRLLGLEGETGLLTALRDDRLDVESLVYDTDISGLAVLPAGAAPEGAAELIASERMREIAAQLSARNPKRVILFDSPPLLVSSEARALVSIPGQVVLVARTGCTSRRAIIDAITHVDKQKLRGLVLNDAHVTEDVGYYDYAYGGTSGTVSKNP
jgi:protein-tyrosine kinase